ncbi:SDR family oxidoreductase [Mycetocola sp. JXN-3]|uniref:SDR family oxidoreductase n=1 Tax=Mycetocola sp. JXN-3 TaxID=2116510 RepID=UPI00165D018B|nr:SDR family oxidoreductase [Mycetocola sp. JXN-3]
MTSQRVVVTGASSGIGAATVALFREKGYEVLGVARRADKLTELAKRTGADVFAADLTSEDDVAALAEYVRSNGGVQILINNAGGAFGLASVEESSVEDWQKMFDINVLGTKRVISALLPNMRRSTAAGETASIVGVTSIAGHTAYEGGGGYNAAKFAERALLDVLRLELSGEPIRVIEIAPGMVHTEEFSLVRFGGDQARADAVYAEVPNPLSAEDIAEAIVHAVELPGHVNIDHLTVKPVAQAAPHKVAKGELTMKR